ncbi:MAG: hypothetical protein WCG16_14080 [Methylococcales bacterium]
MKVLFYKIYGDIVAAILGFYFGTALSIDKIQDESTYGETTPPPAANFDLFIAG